MDRPSILGTLYDIIPNPGLKDPSGLERRIDKAGALVKDPAGADGIVPYFAVSHIIIRGQTDCRTVGFQLRVQIRFEQSIKVGRIGPVNGIRFICFADANAIHDNQQQRAFSAMKGF